MSISKKTNSRRSRLQTISSDIPGVLMGFADVPNEGYKCSQRRWFESISMEISDVTNKDSRLSRRRKCPMISMMIFGIADNGSSRSQWRRF